VTSLLDEFATHVRLRPAAVALHDRGVEYTYGELFERCQRLAGWMSVNGVREGDRVALLLPNSLEYVIAYLAVFQVGGIVVGLNPQTTANELAAVLGHADPVLVVAHERVVELAAEGLAQSCPAGLRFLLIVGRADGWPLPSTISALPFDDAVAARPAEGVRAEVAQIIYTSGTTGRPKGVVLSHRNVMANCRSIVRYLHLTPQDSVLVVLPFFYSYGNSLLFTHLATGGKLVLAPDFVFWNTVLDSLERHAVTGFSGVPATYALLLHKSDIRRRSLPALRYLTCAGGAMPETHVAELRRAIPHARLFLMYGQTEATARLSTLLPEDLDRKPGSIGRGIDGVSLRVLNDRGEPVRPGEVGEIVASGDNVMLGYWRDSEATQRVLRADGLHTGDLAHVDDEGFIYVDGRRDDQIKSGAYRINPQEIEEILLELPGVGEAAVVGVKDEIWGEIPVAFVVASETADDLAETAWQHCRERLPRYKQPRFVRVLEKLPRTASGKVQRAVLRAQWSADFAGRRAPAPMASGEA
jgi:long-chain acyl-CoA synthetase